MKLESYASRDSWPKHREIIARVGEEIHLILPELSGSGYLWNLEEINPNLLVINENNVLDNPSVAGEPLIGGIIDREIKLLPKALGTVCLNLRRPWNNESCYTIMISIE